MKVSAGMIHMESPDQLLLCKFIVEHWSYLGLLMKKEKLSFVAMTTIADPREVM